MMLLPNEPQLFNSESWTKDLSLLFKGLGKGMKNIKSRCNYFLKITKNYKKFLKFLKIVKKFLINFTIFKKEESQVLKFAFQKSQMALDLLH